jgi:hypothetical protein
MSDLTSLQNQPYKTVEVDQQMMRQILIDLQREQVLQLKLR